MRALSAGFLGFRLLCVVAALSGCSVKGPLADQAVPPGLAGCPLPKPPDLASVRAGTPLFARGLIVPPNSVPCAPLATGVPQLNCNHHGSSVAELPDGTLAAVWYHGVAEKSPDSRLLWSRLAPGASTWSAPAVLYDDPQRAEGNPALWVAPDGALVVFYVTIYGSEWNDGRAFFIRSTDGGASWSAPVQLHDRCWMVRHPPLTLHSGDLLLPLYEECLYVPVFMRSRDGGKSWQPGKEVSLLDHFDQIQPALIQRADGTVVALTRDATPVKRIQQMQSADSGVSWSPSVPTELPNAATSIDQVRLPSGHVVVVFNNSPDERFPLTVALSLDEGRSFAAVRDLLADCPEGSGQCSYAYPSITYSQKDGTLWVTYTHNRQTIGWVHFSEAWLAAGQATSRIRCTADEVCADSDHTCQRPCEGDPDCSSTAEPMHCAATGLCAPICPSGRPVIAHCVP
jgi:predicted neuraminidase